ncbi:MAG TPA: hypothetical protein DIC36_07775 [Gammaproteobacteria bacterium]|nr:hypothetical protein [Gammaproteobacteria bacterium]
MFSTALIVFREVIEAALIIGLVLTATRGVANRNRYVLAGIGAGLLGAGVVAFFADTLAQAAEGVGPELFNAGVLLTATAMLAWHNFWMAQHGRALAAEMNAVGAAVSEGSRPVHVLAIVIALAVLREGAEVVLFVYGIAVSGTNTGAMMLGGLLGVVAGVAMGGALYFGLLRIPTRHLFTVTSALLVLLAAGMAAQAAAYLSQAGWLPVLSPMLWDSSAILSQQSLPGEMLHTLVGYVDRPSGIQLVTYLLAVVLIGGLTLASKKPAVLKPTLAAAGALLVAVFTLFNPSPAHAGYKVYYPTIEKGETELELRAHVTFDEDRRQRNEQQFKLGIGHGFTDWWFTELYAEVEREPESSDYELTGYEWENLFRLTEPGKYWADFGFLVEYSRARESSNPNKWELTPIVQKQFGRQLATVNLTFEHETGRNASDDWDLEYAWQYKWLGKPELEFGLEGYGHLGEVTHWDNAGDQRHNLGPAMFGKIKTDSHHAWKYKLAVLFGVTAATPAVTLAGQVEYEF